MILLRERDLAANSVQHPHVPQYTPVFPRYLIPTDARSRQIVNRFLLRERDLTPNSAQRPHVLKTIPVFLRYLDQLTLARYRS